MIQCRLDKVIENTMEMIEVWCTKGGEVWRKFIFSPPVSHIISSPTAINEYRVDEIIQMHIAYTYTSEQNVWRQKILISFHFISFRFLLLYSLCMFFFGFHFKSSFLIHIYGYSLTVIRAYLHACFDIFLRIRVISSNHQYESISDILLLKFIRHLTL